MLEVGKHPILAQEQLKQPSLPSQLEMSTTIGISTKQKPQIGNLLRHQILALLTFLFCSSTLTSSAQSLIPEEMSIAYTAIDKLSSTIFGSVTYYDTASLEEYRNYYYGFYRNNPFKTCFYFYQDPITRQQFYLTTTLNSDGSESTDRNPFPIQQVNRRSYKCDRSVTDNSGATVRFIFNILEDFKITVYNRVTAESGMLVHRGPFPVRVIFSVTPLPRNCTDVESNLPVSDYIDATIPRNSYISGISGRLMNRNYRWGPDFRLNP